MLGNETKDDILLFTDLWNLLKSEKSNLAFSQGLEVFLACL